jgi:hypothetical protein
MAIFIAALLGLSALFIVVAPLFISTAAQGSPDGTMTSSLAERERAARAALHDVEFDFELGNLGEDDYRALRERYTRRTLAALKNRHDRERTLDDAIEARVHALRESDGRARHNGSRTANKARRPNEGMPQ